MQYDRYVWMVYTDFKVRAILAALQGKHSKCCCFVCEYGRRVKTSRHLQQNFLLRSHAIPGNKNIATIIRKSSLMTEFKLKEGICVDPQVKELVENHIFISKLNEAKNSTGSFLKILNILLVQEFFFNQLQE